MPNYHDINLSNHSSDIFVNVMRREKLHDSALRIMFDLMMLRSWALKSCVDGLYHPAVQKLIESDARFDLLITESFHEDCFLGFVHRFKAPFISFSSHQLMPWANKRFSNDDNPSYTPSIFLSFSPSMTFFERSINAVTSPLIKLFYDYAFNPSMQIIARSVFGPDIPSLSEIPKNTSLLFVNTHFSLHGSKPNLPNVIEVGGIHIQPIGKALPNEFQRFLDEAEEGVLFCSLGSIIKASNMPTDKLKVILNVIREIPRKVIWKWEAGDLPNKPSNLLIQSWLPQAAILRK